MRLLLISLAWVGWFRLRRIFMPNALDQLRECSFKGVPFPTTSLKMDLSHDLAQHKYWGVDGAHIEATGRAPLVFHVSIPFRNNIAKAAVESWNNLYPDAYRAFMDAAAEKRTGIFVHPELGEFTVKLSTASSHWDPNKRDGVDVEATFIETVVPNDNSPVFASASPLGEGLQASLDLDVAIKTVAPNGNLSAIIVPATPLNPPPSVGVYKPDFFETLRQIAGIGDQLSLINKQIAGKISNLQYRVQAIKDSFAGVKQPKFWPVQDSAERLQNALYQLQQKLLQEQQSVSLYIVPQRTSLAGVAQDVRNTVAQVVKLNPALVSSPYVEAKTAVRYYAP